MTDAPPTPSAQESAASAEACGESLGLQVERWVRRLDDVAERALRAADKLERRMDATPADAPAEDLQRLAGVHAKELRTVQAATFLQFRLVSGLHRLQREALEGEAASERARAKAREPLKEDRKAQIGNIVERVAERDGGRHYDEVDRIVGEVAGRLLDEDLYGDVLTRPISDMVAEICRDLNLTPDWLALSREAWAREELASGAPGEPLKARAAQAVPANPPQTPGDLPTTRLGPEPQSNPRSASP